MLTVYSSLTLPIALWISTGGTSFRSDEDWATGLIQAALLRVLKKRAAQAEEFDVAARRRWKSIILL